MTCNLRSPHVTSLLHTLTRRPSDHHEAGQERSLVLVPRGGDPVEVSTLWLVSPLVREVMASVASEDKVILLPDCDKEDVTRGLALLRDSGHDDGDQIKKKQGSGANKTKTHTEEDKYSISKDGTLCYNDPILGKVPVNPDLKAVSSNKDDEKEKETYDNSDTQNEDINEKHTTIGESTYDPRDYEEKPVETGGISRKIWKENVMKDHNSAKSTKKSTTKRKFTAMFSVSCPFCSSEFFGNNSKLKDKLKCHLGRIHFLEEMEMELKRYFLDDDKCEYCDRFFKGSLRRKST